MLKLKKQSVLGLVGGVLLSGVAAAQTTPDLGIKLPPNYFSRFGMTSLVASNAYGVNGFGVRYFPLPLPADLRLSVVKRPLYWEYALYTRQNDTTFQAGVFDNGDAAKNGIMKVELDHNPRAGLQYAALIQDIDQPTRVHVSRFSVGYANLFLNNRVRLLNNVGIAFQKEVVAPYTYSVLSGGYTQKVNTYVSLGVNAAGILYTFPAQKEYQASVDVTPNIQLRPTPELTLNARHLERFVTSTSPTPPIPDFNLDRYQQTDASVDYRLPFKTDFSVNMLRTRVTRDWTNNRTYLYNDILFRVNALPVIVGPTVGYQWWPANKDGTKSVNTHFTFGFSTAPKR